MDTYVYTKNVPLDFSYISGEMKKIGLIIFKHSFSDDINLIPAKDW